MNDTGILLINLGSPDAADVASVRAYLNQFLMDRHVLDIPWPIRRLLVSGIILPTRPKRSAHAYQQIWRDSEPGSPLLYHSQALADALAAQTNQPVALAMRYGNPTIQSGIQALCEQGVSEIVAAPLYPQHAASTRTTSLEEVAKHVPDHIQWHELPPFFADEHYLSALAEVTKAHLPDGFDHLLMSYHGLPERHLTRADPTGNHCLKSDACCEAPSAAHATCYRHQARVTSERLAERLGLTADQWSMSYQSRLGRLPWLAPYTDQVLQALPDQGVRDLAVVCPAFTADNLETLEEIGISGKEIFIAAGGERLTLIPCLNAEPVWVAALARLCATAARHLRRRP